MASSLHVSFQLKKFRKDEKGQVPIYVRLTINDNRCEFSIKRSVDPDKWISNVGVAKGTTEEIKNLNAYLNTVKLKLFEHYRQLLEAGKSITPESIRNAYFGITEKSKTILDVFEYHNSQVKALLNKEFSFGTYERYCTALSHTKEFIQ